MVRSFFSIIATCIVLVFASNGAYAGKKAADCEMCNRFKNPRPRELKPIACIPIKFDQWHSGSVVVRIEYADGTSKYDSKPVAGITGQFCFGAHRFRNASLIEICNDDFSAKLRPADIDKGLSRKHPGWYTCLKGTEYCLSHDPRS